MKSGSPVLIFENGMGVGLGNWDTLLDELSKLAPVVAYDRANVEKSDRVYEMPTVKRIAENLRAIHDTLQIPPPYVLIGHSMGGLYARGFAGFFPDDIAGLDFIDPADFTENIVFTELNHNFINPESEKPEYTAAILSAFKNMTIWNDPKKPARSYNDAYSSFNEYMNWALVCLRDSDFAPKIEQDILIQQIEKMMVESRAFIKFAEFDQFLLKLYKNRKKRQVLADLYPEIVH